MGKLTKETFNESCCDGGETSCNDNSAQSCGCDKGANWVCQRHQTEALRAIEEKFAVPVLPHLLPGEDPEHRYLRMNCGCVPGITNPYVCQTHRIEQIERRTRAAYEAKVPLVQAFDTGATRNSDTHKFDYEGFLNPAVLHTFGAYMHEHRLQRDGSLRDSDNWQKGIPLAKYMKSLLRHTFDLWMLHRGYPVKDPDTGLLATKKDLCCAILFNVQGYLLQLLKEDV